MDSSQRPTPRTIPTGCPELDLATGIGGVPRGALTDIGGDDEARQAELVLGLVARAQGRGLACVVVDGGRGMDLAAARQAGVDLSSTLVCQPSSAEEVLDLALTLVRTREVGLLVVDSIGLLPTRGGLAPHEEELYLARLVSRSMRELHTEASRVGCAVVFAARSADRGAQPGAALGSNALRFYASLRVEAQRATGATLIRKNKFAPLPALAEAA